MRKVLFLSKRLYMGKDLLADRYGRFREIPLHLARIGHPVRAMCLSYRERDEGDVTDDGVVWTSRNLGAGQGLIGYIRLAGRIAQSFRPDVVIAGSDAFHAIIGRHIARRASAALVLDLYDNFESFRGTRWPMIFGAYRQAVRQADLVACITDPFAELVTSRYGRSGPTVVLENGVDTHAFRPADRDRARAALGLPLDRPLFGVVGALARSRDIETVFAATDILSHRKSPAMMVVAGPRDAHLTWPLHTEFRDLGMLPYDRIPQVIAALDLVVVPNRDSDFGRFCHPQKAVEASACERAIVAADTGVMATLMQDRSDALYAVGDAQALAKAIEANLGRTPFPMQVAHWHDIAHRLSQAIENLP